MKITQQQAQGIIRHTLTFAGGLVVAQGVIDADTLATIVGSITTLFGAVWSILSKKA